MVTHNVTQEHNDSAKPKDSPTPLAIVGIGCRLPGGSQNPDAFWENLLAGKDCIIDVPDNRWDINKFYDENRNKLGKMHVKSGGFLQEKIDEFDALFFGISPREANSLDPQQRLLLEISWEAFEDAGIAPDSLAKTKTGVFIGGFMMDNKLTQFSPLNRETIGSNTAVGMSLTMLSNRLSYTYDLRGPSLSIDTACSSSMVALDQACRSIWSGDSSMALVGGVNVMHRPEVFIAMCKGGFLSPDGRCKSFDERANGYGRGEGAGIVLVKPLEEAEKNGDKIYAVIKATGCNQDGHTDGITVPNPDSQKALIHQVTQKANVNLKEVQFFEAHGTGTPVGDPLEMSAIGGTIGQEKDNGETCLVGSVKGNIGHLEAASGIAAIIKSALCLKHKKVPPQANLINLNPNIPFDDLNIKIPRSVETLQEKNGTIISGINSFGYGGTNACAILESYPQADTTNLNDKNSPQNTLTIDTKHYVLPLSAKSKPALKALANKYQQLISSTPNLSINDLVFSAGERRAHLTNRLSVTASSMDELHQTLIQYNENEHHPQCIESTVNNKKDKIAFVFTGMGPQWWAMGRDLMNSEPVFLASLKRSNHAFINIAGWSILDEMLKDEADSIITETQVAQTANFVLQVALVELWASWGITPSAIIGHSVGEVTTSYISGILSLEDALLVSYHRSRIQKKAAGQGAMLAVGLTEQQSLDLIAPYADKISIAAINAPTAITLAGDEKILNQLAEKLTNEAVFNRLLQVEVPYHSPLMDPLLAEITDSLAKLKPKKPNIPTYSTVSGEQVHAESFDAQYWCDNVRQPVYFFKALEQMIKDGYEDFLEIGPHPVLSSSIKECFAKSNIDGFLAMSLKRKTNEQATIKNAVAALYNQGYTLNWQTISANQFIESNTAYYQAITPRFVNLPTYPWQRDRYWNDSEIAAIDRQGAFIQHDALGTKELGSDEAWKSHINSHFHKHITDHQVEGLIILAGATYVEAGLAAYKALTQQDACLIKDLHLHNAMVIESDNEPLMRTSFNPKDNSYQIHSYQLTAPDETTLHATGFIEPLTLIRAQPLPIENIKSVCYQTLNADSIYQELAARGLEYGEYFQGINHIWRRDQEVLALITAHQNLELPADNYQLHPTLLDACFQSLISAIPVDSDFSQQVYVPVNIGQFRHYKKLPTSFYCHGKLNIINGREIIGDMTICDEYGDVFVEICDLRCQALRQINTNKIENLDEWTYKSTWQPLTELPIIDSMQANENLILFVDNSPASQALISECQKLNNARITLLYQNGTVTDNDLPHTLSSHIIDVHNKEQLISLFGSLTKDNAHKIIYVPTEQFADEDPIQLKNTHTLLTLTQTLETVSTDLNIRLYVVTHDAAKVIESDNVVGFTYSSLIGLSRVISAEHPHLNCTLIDLEIHCDNNLKAQYVINECLANNTELEVAYRNHERYGYRLANMPLTEAYLAKTIKANSEHAYVLATQTEYGHSSPNIQITDRVAPSEHEIEIKVDSTLLQESSHHVMANREVAATVIRVGKHVEKFAPNDQILAIYTGKLSNYVTLPVEQMLAIKRPSHWVTTSAGALSAYAVAYTGLVSHAKATKHHSVLIIGGNSLIGQAAVALAKIIGCSWISVTKDDPKLSLYSSSLTHDLLVKNNNNGFDIIVDTQGPQANLQLDDLLSLHGLYINTISNKDTVIKLSPTKSQVILTTDALRLSLKQQTTSVLNEIAQACQNNTRALSALTLPIHKLNNVLFNEQAPIVINNNDINDLNIIDKSTAKVSIRSDVSYLISGGFGGFGLGMAKWLVEQGARSLILVSRSGVKTAEAQHAIQQFIDQGVIVKAAALDIANTHAVADLIDDINQSMAPLKGVFHAAGVLDDKELLAMDKLSLEKVMQPKAQGAWNLHKSTLELELDCFVLYSSVSAMIGNRNQANYVAANLFLDNLAHYRHAQGLSATSINWGALADVGMAAENPSVINHLAHVGIHAFSQEQALEAFAAVLNYPVAQLGIFNVDWQRWKQFEVASSQSRFATLIAADDELENGDQWHALLEQGIDTITPAVIEKLSHLIAETLKLSEQQIDIDVPINRFGLDSLMAMDLQMKFRNEFKVDVSILELMKGNSIEKLSNAIVDKLSTTESDDIDESTDASELDTQVVDELVDQINLLSELSEEELDAMLAKELEAS